MGTVMCHQLNLNAIFRLPCLFTIRAFLCLFLHCVSLFVCTEVVQSFSHCYCRTAMSSGWAELNFENVDDSMSMVSAVASRPSVGSAPPPAGSSSSTLLSQRQSRSTLPYSVRFFYFAAFCSASSVIVICKPNQV